MSRTSTRPLVDLAAGGTLEDVVAAAQGRPIRIELETSMRYTEGTLKTVCSARPMTQQSGPTGAARFVPLCMPVIGETWAEVLNPLAQLLDDQQWSDVRAIETATS